MNFNKQQCCVKSLLLNAKKGKIVFEEKGNIFMNVAGLFWVLFLSDSLLQVLCYQEFKSVSFPCDSISSISHYVKVMVHLSLTHTY